MLLSISYICVVFAMTPWNICTGNCPLFVHLCILSINRPPAMPTQLTQLLSHRQDRTARVLSQGSNVSPKFVIRALKGSLKIQSQQSVPCSALFSSCRQHWRDSDLENVTLSISICIWPISQLIFFFPFRKMKAFRKDHLFKKLLKATAQMPFFCSSECLPLGCLKRCH